MTCTVDTTNSCSVFKPSVFPISLPSTCVDTLSCFADYWVTIERNMMRVKMPRYLDLAPWTSDNFSPALFGVSYPLHVHFSTHDRHNSFSSRARSSRLEYSALSAVLPWFKPNTVTHLLPSCVSTPYPVQPEPQPAPLKYARAGYLPL